MTTSHAGDRQLMLPNEADLAWQVAAEVSPHLTRDDKAALYLTLGCDENFKAIVEALALARECRIRLSNNALASVARWLDGYIGAIEEPAIRKLLYQVHVQTRWAPIGPLPSPAVIDPRPPARAIG